MASRTLFRARMCLGFAVCLVGLSYWIFWYSVWARPMLMRAWLHWESNTSVRCMRELLLDFDIESLNLSAPTYVRLAQPRPISSACEALIAKPDNATVTNFVKLEPLKPHAQMMLHSEVQRLLTSFRQRNLEFFLAGGSLLGSVRHFGHFPWDADADVMIPAHQKPRVRQLLIELSASGEMRFADTERINEHWQLGVVCPVGRNRSSGYHGVVYSLTQESPIKPCAAMIDLFFGHAGAKQYTRKEYPKRFPMEAVYPLTVRPYGPYLMPVPRNPRKFLTAVYGGDYEQKCVFKYYDHKTYKCADLRSIYPLVIHLQLPYYAGMLSVDLLVRGPDMLSLFIPAQA